MKKIYIILTYLLLQDLILQAQTSFIGDGSNPVVDKFSNSIYYKKLIRDNTGKVHLPIRRKNVSGDSLLTIKMPSVPSFANYSHKAIISFIGDGYEEEFADWAGGFYFIDFEKMDSLQLLIPLSEVINFPFWRSIGKVLFSPDDSKVLLFPFNSVAYYSFKDNKIHDPGISIFTQLMPEWTSDTTFIYCPNGGDTRLIEYNYSTNKMDTIINKIYPPHSMGDFSYSKKNNSILYSSHNYQNQLHNELYYYDLKTRTEKEVFQHSNISLPTYGAYFLEYIKWSPDCNKAVIIPSSAIEPNDSRILIYYAKNDSLYLYNNLSKYDYTYRNDINWYNDDIFIYTQGGNLLYSFDTSIKVSVNENNIYNKYTYTLEQNYPNPFNPITKIVFAIPVASNVKIKIFDVLGQEITTLQDEYKAAGKYDLTFDGSNLSSGIYFYGIICNNYVSYKKMILLK